MTTEILVSSAIKLPSKEHQSTSECAPLSKQSTPTSLLSKPFTTYAQSLTTQSKANTAIHHHFHVIIYFPNLNMKSWTTVHFIKANLMQISNYKLGVLTGQSMPGWNGFAPFWCSSRKLPGRQMTFFVPFIVSNNYIKPHRTLSTDVLDYRAIRVQRFK